MRFENPKEVTINDSRWDLSITIIDKDGKQHEFFASADSYYGSGSGLWFGTKSEKEEWDEEN